MSWNETNVPDQTGRIALVTGGNGGLGPENCRSLAAKGTRVIMAARNQEKAADATADIVDLHPGADVEVMEFDLASLESIEAFTKCVRDDHYQIDILINNAGVMAISERRTADGFEMQFGTNHLGDYVLTARLLPPPGQHTGLPRRQHHQHGPALRLTGRSHHVLSDLWWSAQSEIDVWNRSSVPKLALR